MSSIRYNTCTRSMLLLAAVACGLGFGALPGCRPDEQPVRITAPADGSCYGGGDMFLFRGNIDADESRGPYRYAWSFGDGAAAHGLLSGEYRYDRQGTYTLSLTVASASGVIGRDSVTVHIRSSRYVKVDALGRDLPDDAAGWSMVYDTTTGLEWEVKQNLDFIMDYTNPHDADTVYTWYDGDYDTHGGDPGEWGDGNNTEMFVRAVNEAAPGGHTDWRLPTCSELATIQNRYRFNPAINTEYFPHTRSWYYWSSTTYEQFSDAACHIYFMGHPPIPQVTAQNHYGYKTISYLARAVRDRT